MQLTVSCGEKSLGAPTQSVWVWGPQSRNRGRIFRDVVYELGSAKFLLDIVLMCLHNSTNFRERKLVRSEVMGPQSLGYAKNIFKHFKKRLARQK
jgi:hypothetical protein